MAGEVDEKLLPGVDDPLLECLVFVGKKHGMNFTADSIRARIPTTQKRITPGLLVQTAESLKISCRFLKRRLSKISKLVLPCILLLKEGRACVLLNVSGKEAEVFIPETGAQKLPLSELKEEYSGYAFFLKPEYDFETRSDEKKLFRVEKNWFWGTFLRFGDLYSRVILASIFINLFVIAVPLFIMNVYDRVVPNQAIETLWVLTIGIMLVFGFDFILKNLRAYFIDTAGKKIDIILSSALLEKTLNIPMNSQATSAGVRANQVREFEFLREFFSSATVATLVDLPFVLIFISIIGMIGGKLMLIPTQVAALVIISSVLISIPLMRAVKQSFVGNGQKAALLHETIAGVETIKSTTSQGYFLGRWQKYVALAATYAQKSRFWSTLAVLTSGTLIALATIGVVVWGVYLIRDGELTVGGLIACTILTGRALAPLGQISSILTRYQQAKCSLTALDDLMKAEDETQKENTIQITDLKGEIELENEIGRAHV